MNHKAVGAVLLLCCLPGYFLGAAGRAALCALVAAVAWWISARVDPPRDLTPDRPKRALLHDKFSISKVPDPVDCVVIGGGLGGLTAAAVIARTGKRVVVLEQHPDVVGGGTHSFDLKGYRFDSGLHYTVPWNGPLFSLSALIKLADAPAFDLMGTPDGTFDKVVIGEGEPFCIKHGERHMDQLRKEFPADQKGIDAYMQLAGDSMAAVKLFIVGKLLPKALQPLFWRLMPKRFVATQRQTGEDLLGGVINSKRLRSLLCGLWIDTGARPDQAAFLMTGAVQRGLPLEGGCYPRGGAHTLAECLIPVIEKWGGRVLIDAAVGEIVCDETTGRVEGVTMRDGTVIECPLVVSSAGYYNTFTNLVSPKVCARFGIPRDLGVKQSPGFVMANIAIKAIPAEVDVTNTNLWVHPADKEGDIFPAMRSFFADPMSHDPPVMFTFPSMKDQTWHQTHPEKLTCQMLVMAEWDWFSKWSDEPQQNRGGDYEQYKAQWEEKCLTLLYRHFPKVKGKVQFVDVSTPLSINHWLGAYHGAAVGLGVNPERFFDPSVQQHLDATTPIPGLYQTGHDVTMPGVVMAQLAGVITGWKVIGFFPALRQLLQSIFLL
eukprot:TRINITY_DN50061_c0_g1_i1.p1 TRINITY_DN50061_c0_g1~~TRINITY_DN50061_c0_g1_i1.p1  ORF type:complete len:602 (+),score=157.73 TRINITY_DN50061_c0_g1_i1:106-1911(+)